MEKNKTGKPAYRTGRYLKYAIGEIVLVVIGILIALQINNWNDKKKAIANSKVFLSEISKDIISDTLYLSAAIIAIQENLDAKEWMLNQTSYHLNDLDSIQMSFNKGYWDFYINDRTFQKIQNSPESKLVGYDSLYNSISHYYSTIKKRIEKNTEFEIKESNKVDVNQFDILNKIDLDIPLSRVFHGKVVEKKFPLLQGKEERDQLLFNSLNFIKLRNDIKMEYMRHSFLLNGFLKCKKEADGLLIAIHKVL